MSVEFRTFPHLTVYFAYLSRYFLLNLSVWLVVMVYLSKLVNYG